MISFMEKANHHLDSLRPKIKTITMDEKIQELLKEPGFDLFIDRVYTQMRIEGRMPKFLD